MSNYYNLDGVKTYLAKTLDENETLLAAWKAVTFNTKKDGSPFAALAKNFNNARIGRECYDTLEYEKRVYIYGQSKCNGYVSDSIKLWDNVHYMTDKTKLAKTENILKVGSGFYDQYIFDMQDIRNAIADRIAYLEKYCTELRKSLEKVDTVYHNFKIAYERAMKTLENDTKEFESKTMFYAVRETIKERYPYC